MANQSIRSMSSWSLWRIMRTLLKKGKWTCVQSCSRALLVVCGGVGSWGKGVWAQNLSVCTLFEASASLMTFELPYYAICFEFAIAALSSAVAVGLLNWGEIDPNHSEPLSSHNCLKDRPTFWTCSCRRRGLQQKASQ